MDADATISTIADPPHGMAWHGMVGVIVLSGCGSPSTSPVDVAAILGRAGAAEASVAVHDLGPILARGQELQHAFALSNPSARPLRLLGAEALTPCCSAIGPLPEGVPPNETVEVPVVSRPGHQHGRKQVRFLVCTDDPAQSVRAFALVASLIAEIEVKAHEDSETSLPLDQEGHQRFTVTCRRIEASGDDGTTIEGRQPPNRLRASPPLAARFLDDPVEQRAADGTITATRSVEVALPAMSEVGSQRGEVVLEGPDGLNWTQLIAWQVIPRIRATPPGLVLRPDAADPTPTFTVTLRAEDQPFRITGLNGPILAAPVATVPGDPAKTHTLHLTLDPARVESGVGSDLHITTDHPDQGEVDLSVLVLPSGGNTP